MSDIQSTTSIASPRDTQSDTGTKHSASISGAPCGSVQKDTLSKINTASLLYRANEIRERLRNPPNAVYDPGINLKRKDIQRPMPTIAKLMDVMGDIDASIMELQSQIQTLKARRAEYQSELFRRSRPTDQIKKLVAAYYNIKLTDMMSDRRNAEVVRPRQIAMYLIKEMTPMSYPKIGQIFGGRDHTTAMHAVKRVEQLMADDTKVRAEIAELVESIREMQAVPTLIDDTVG